MVEHAFHKREVVGSNPTPDTNCMKTDPISQKLIAICEAAIDNKTFPGCVIGVIHDNGEKLLLPVGRYTYEQSATAMQNNSIFDIASVTKSIPTASLALRLIDQNKLHLDDKLITYVPEFRSNYREQVTIRHLLTQTLNFGNVSLAAFAKEHTGKELLDFILTRELTESPGKSYWYMNITSILLGIIIERATNTSLDVLAKKEFFDPLDMKSTSFHTNELDQDLIVPTEIDAWRNREIRGEVHDESAWVLSQNGIIVGSAGIFSTVPDILVFLDMLLHRGTLQGQTFFQPNTLAQINTNQLTDAGETIGLGWEVDRPWLGDKRSSKSFGKTGFTGCSVAIDINRQIGFVILSNSTYPKRKDIESHKELNYQFRRCIADIIWE